MTIKSFKLWLINLGLASLFCCCTQGPTSALSSSAYAADTQSKPTMIERDYLVKGMTCSGCIYGVKKALERSGINKSQILEVAYDKPDSKNKIGHAKVKFQSEEYKGKETDCKIAKEVLSNPGYQVFWDQSDPNPCKL